MTGLRVYTSAVADKSCPGCNESYPTHFGSACPAFSGTGY
ncbi:hypothetical protein [Lutimonas sp.]